MRCPEGGASQTSFVVRSKTSRHSVGSDSFGSSFFFFFLVLGFLIRIGLFVLFIFIFAS